MSEEAQKESIIQSTIVKMNEAGSVQTKHDHIAVEEPLEIRLGNDPFVVTMRTPGHDEDLAVGFLVTEGIIKNRSDIKQLSRCPTSPTPENTLRVDLKQDTIPDGIKSSRHGAIAASCGVCGKTSIDMVKGQFPLVYSMSGHCAPKRFHG